MRHYPEPAESAQQAVDLTPLLDVVFILLIFFIVTASFVREYGLDVSRTDASERPPIVTTDILVTVDDGNRIWIDARLIDPRALRANIERLRAEAPDRRVIVDADNRSSNRTLVWIMDASRQAGIADILLAER